MRKLAFAVLGTSMLCSACDFSGNEEKLNDRQIREAIRGDTKEDKTPAEETDAADEPEGDVVGW